MIMIMFSKRLKRVFVFMKSKNSQRYVRNWKNKNNKSDLQWVVISIFKISKNKRKKSREKKEKGKINLVISNQDQQLTSLIFRQDLELINNLHLSKVRYIKVKIQMEDLLIFKLILQQESNNITVIYIVLDK